jgi:peptidyl-tRNA hydrolase
VGASKKQIKEFQRLEVGIGKKGMEIQVREWRLK